MEKLPATELKNPQAIEIHIINKIKKLISTNEIEFPDEIKKLIIDLMSIKEQMVLTKEEIESMPLYQIIQKRIEFCFTFKITDTRLLLLICSICKVPGRAVLYLWYIQDWSFRNNVEEITFLDFCQKIFPWGFPKETGLHEIWKKQKTATKEDWTVNLVDYASAGKSILEK